MLAKKDFFILLARLFLGYIFISSGLCKVSHGHFGQLIGPPQLETMLSRYGLGLFANLIGITQVICGLLLFSQRFSTLGAIVLLPMNICIMGVTISMGWQGTPFVNALLILLNILIILYDWHKLKFLFWTPYLYNLKTTALDELTKSIYPLLALAAGLSALILANLHYQLTACAAIFCFLLVGFSIYKSRLCSKLQLFIVLQALANMIILTISGRLTPMIIQIIGINTLLLLLLFLISLFLSSPKPVKVTATVKAG